MDFRHAGKHCLFSLLSSVPKSAPKAVKNSPAHMAEGRFQNLYLTVLFSSYHCGNKVLHKLSATNSHLNTVLHYQLATYLVCTESAQTRASVQVCFTVQQQYRLWLPLRGSYSDEEPHRSHVSAENAGMVSTPKCCCQNLPWRTATVNVRVERWQYPSSAKWVRSTRSSKLATMEYNSQEICDLEKDEREAFCLFKSLLPGVSGESIKTF